MKDTTTVQYVNTSREWVSVSVDLSAWLDDGVEYSYAVDAAHDEIEFKCEDFLSFNYSDI